MSFRAVFSVLSCRVCAVVHFCCAVLRCCRRFVLSRCAVPSYRFVLSRCFRAWCCRAWCCCSLLLGYVRLSETAVLVAIPFEEICQATHLCFPLLMKAKLTKFGGLLLPSTPNFGIPSYKFGPVFVLPRAPTTPENCGTWDRGSRWRSWSCRGCDHVDLPGM